MNIDLRRFDYPFEPLLQQRQWELDALIAKLGKLQSEIQETQAFIESLQANHRKQSHEISLALSHRLDPSNLIRSLNWLAGLHRQIFEWEKQLSELQAQRSELSAQCIDQQQKVDVIEAHREECILDYSQQESGRQAKDADQEWLTNLSARKSANGMPIANRQSRSIGKSRVMS